eukprot:Blabericola_migrator_1__4504@NODE_2400_length_2818_cov_197_769902_g1374_i1_p1_GENE_NODE_2400_length_2818_cov_197_769902_g1374_i1NODE_2400_length_2818_cov_197_769902_g1374_i1_p1_ORF_typecomplete_len630_score115_61zfpiccolo/PF05715_13/0_84zfpiccolo/PF05715_13/7_5DZR/PF12773_7/0_26DZR/PF12773_7/4_9e02DUF285/PF03382_14/0_35Cys_rich_CPCC/PF14206_6/11Cys_rich_CPCC/PF14206_6/54Vps36NZFN/PF16988_5/4_3e03Vps36NZFN/PF16988_5/0_24Vps36NZFN/PF16988_5/2_1e03_NODE_2400_length_2818_cov_197_769902_g1374_i155924
MAGALFDIFVIEEAPEICQHCGQRRDPFSQETETSWICTGCTFENDKEEYDETTAASNITAGKKRDWKGRLAFRTLLVLRERVAQFIERFHIVLNIDRVLHMMQGFFNKYHWPRSESRLQLYTALFCYLGCVIEQQSAPRLDSYVVASDVPRYIFVRWLYKVCDVCGFRTLPQIDFRQLVSETVKRLALFVEAERRGQDCSAFLPNTKLYQPGVVTKRWRTQGDINKKKKKMTKVNTPNGTQGSWFRAQRSVGDTRERVGGTPKRMGEISLKEKQTTHVARVEKVTSHTSLIDVNIWDQAFIETPSEFITHRRLLDDTSTQDTRDSEDTTCDSPPDGEVARRVKLEQLMQGLEEAAEVSTGPEIDPWPHETTYPLKGDIADDSASDPDSASIHERAGPFARDAADPDTPPLKAPDTPRDDTANVGDRDEMTQLFANAASLEENASDNVWDISLKEDDNGIFEEIDEVTSPILFDDLFETKTDTSIVDHTPTPEATVFGDPRMDPKLLQVWIDTVCALGEICDIDRLTAPVPHVEKRRVTDPVFTFISLISIGGRLNGVKVSQTDLITFFRVSRTSLSNVNSMWVHTLVRTGLEAGIIAEEEIERCPVLLKKEVREVEGRVRFWGSLHLL